MLLSVVRSLSCYDPEKQLIALQVMLCRLKHALSGCVSRKDKDRYACFSSQSSNRSRDVSAFHVPTRWRFDVVGAAAAIVPNPS